MEAKHPNPALSSVELRAVEQILRHYAQGWFPMADDSTPEMAVRWVQPEARAIVPLDDRFTIGRSLRAKVRTRRFRVTSDQAFERVIRACARPRARDTGRWLSEDIAGAFELLHRAGCAHSIEAWLAPGAPGEPERLVGGLYGLAQGSVFCGESMFCRPELGGTDASKVCLVHLVHHLRLAGFTLLDAQIQNAHTDQFGAVHVTRSKYLKLLADARTKSVAWPPFDPLMAVLSLTRSDHNPPE